MSSVSFKKMRKVIVHAAFAGLIVLPGWTAPVDLEQAEMAAQAWAVRGETLGAPMGERIENSAVHTTENGAKFYTVKTKGGGTIVMTSDDELEPVLAFTDEDTDWTTLDRDSPMWAVIDRHVSGMKERLANKPKMAAAGGAPGMSPPTLRWKTLIAEGEEIRKNGLPKMGSGTRVGDKAISDMRVPTLCKTKWSQGGGIYNYYTPYHRVCGCVATAQSQIMRKHCWPTKSLKQKTRTCKVSGVETNLTTQGGTFDWANMPYSDIAEEYQKQAIGKLTSDVGICQQASYGSGGTSAYTSDIRYTLRNDFGYGAAVYVYDGSGFGTAKYRNDALAHIFFANFDAGLPIAVGVKNHEILADGYGYIDKVDYVHFNFGWAGTDNAWYHVPDLTDASSSYSYIDDFVYNIMPTNGMKEAVLSGRVLAKAGYPVRGATVKARVQGTQTWVATTTTSEYGVWAFVLSAGASSTPKEYDVVVEPFGNYKSGEKSGIALTYPDSYYLQDVTTISALGNSWGNDITVEMVNPDYPEVPNEGATFENHAAGDTRVIDEDDDGGIAKETHLGKFWWGPDARGEVIGNREQGIGVEGNYASLTGMVYRAIHNAYDVTNSPTASAADFATEEIGEQGFVFDAMVRLEDAQDMQDGQDVLLPDDDVKIAVVAKKAKGEGLGEVVVIAGDGVNDRSTKVYETGRAVDTSKMHRLTIQAKGTLFSIWVDGRVIGDYPSRILTGERAETVRAMGFLGTDTRVDDVFFSREVPPFVLPGMMFLIK